MVQPLNERAIPAIETYINCIGFGLSKELARSFAIGEIEARDYEALESLMDVINYIEMLEEWNGLPPV